MNQKKIDFIMCCNNLNYFEECIYYINQLTIPEGFTVGVIPIWGAKSMTSGYNNGMKMSEAKYKIYIHQDVFCVEKDMLIDLVDIFQDESIGMIGMAGSTFLPENAAFSLAWNVLNTYVCNGVSSFQLYQGLEESIKYHKVEAIDGMFMATQYDILWDEQNFDGWHFYDISQSMRIREKYSIVVPSEKTYIMHDAGPCSYETWDDYRKIFCELHPEFEYTHIDLPNYNDIRKQKNKIKELLIENQIQQAISEFSLMKSIEDSELAYIYIFLELYVKVLNTTGNSIRYNQERFCFICDKLRFLIFRKQFIVSGDFDGAIKDFLLEENISGDMFDIMKCHYEMQFSPVKNYNVLLEKIQIALYAGDFFKANGYLESVTKYNAKLAFLFRIFGIFKVEARSSCPYTILDYSLDIYKLVQHFIQMKLLLRRLEYDVARETWDQIYHYIEDNNVSGYFLVSILSIDMFEPQKATKNLIEIIEKNGKQDTLRIEILYNFMKRFH